MTHVHIQTVRLLIEALEEEHPEAVDYLYRVLLILGAEEINNE